MRHVVHSHTFATTPSPTCSHRERMSTGEVDISSAGRAAPAQRIGSRRPDCLLTTLMPGRAWGHDATADEPVLRRNTRTVLAQLTGDAGARQQPDGTMAHLWHRAVYTGVSSVPGPHFVGAWRGSAHPDTGSASAGLRRRPAASGAARCPQARGRDRSGRPAHLWVETVVPAARAGQNNVAATGLTGRGASAFRTPSIAAAPSLPGRTPRRSPTSRGTRRPRRVMRSAAHRRSGGPMRR